MARATGMRCAQLRVAPAQFRPSMGSAHAALGHRSPTGRNRPALIPFPSPNGLLLRPPRRPAMACTCPIADVRCLDAPSSPALRTLHHCLPAPPWAHGSAQPRAHSPPDPPSLFPLSSLSRKPLLPGYGSALAWPSARALPRRRPLSPSHPTTVCDAGYGSYYRKASNCPPAIRATPASPKSEMLASRSRRWSPARAGSAPPPGQTASPLPPSPRRSRPPPATAAKRQGLCPPISLLCSPAVTPARHGRRARGVGAWPSMAVMGGRTARADKAGNLGPRI